jgi:tight adherence protein B
MLVPAVIFAVVLCTVLAVFYTAVQRPEDSARQFISRRLKGVGAPSGTRAKRSSLLRHANEITAVPALDRLLAPLGVLTRPLDRQIEQAALKLTVGALLLTSAIAALVAYAVAYVLVGYHLLALPVAAVAFWLPLVFVKFKATRRIHTFEDQFPDTIDLISRALRAGHTFTTALQMVADESPQPVAGEFKQLYDQQNFGLPLPDAMRDFANRIPLLDAKFFVTAVLTQRESGGNLSEVLDNLSKVIRERFKVKRQIRVISAHGRMTGAVLTALPPFLAVCFMAINPGHLGLMIGDPLGVWMIAGAVVLQVTGGLIIKKLVNIEY